MRIFRKKIEGDLNLNFNSVAGYTLPWLPFFKRTIEMAFPHLKVKAENVPAYHNSQPDAPGFGLYADNPTDPALRVSEDSSGYSFSITADNTQALILGQYRVGESLLRDFRSEHLTEADIMRNGSAVMVLAGPSDAHFCSARFLFTPPDDFKGELNKAKKEILETCVLSEARFFISGRRVRPKPEINEALGVKLLKKEKFRGTPKSLPMGVNQSGGDPIAYILGRKYSPELARNSYIELTNYALYNAPIEAVKANIENIFKDHSEPNRVMSEIAYMFNDDWHTMFMFTLDWNAEVQDFAHQITLALGKHAQKVSLPDCTAEPYKSIAAPGVMESYSNSLKDAGFDLWSMDTGADYHALFVTHTKDSQTIQSLMEATHVLSSPA